MVEKKPTLANFDIRSPWVLDTRELGRRPGHSRAVRRQVAATTSLGVPDVITVPVGGQIELDLLLEAVMEGVLVTGTAVAPVVGHCARCLDRIEDTVEVDLTELFAYPDSTTEATTDDDEVGLLVDEHLDLEPLVRDAVVLALPQSPLCQEDCPGLCVECGLKWVDLEPGHEHEKIDPRWAALVERFDETPSSGGEDRAR